MMNPEMDKIAIDSMSVIRQHEKRAWVGIATNGGIGRKKAYFDMGAAGVVFKFAVEGTTQEIHERYRQGVNFSKLIENIEATKEGMRSTNQDSNNIVFYVLPWSHTVDDMENIVALAKKYEANIVIEYPRHASTGTPAFDHNDEYLYSISIPKNIDGDIKWGQYGDNFSNVLVGSFGDLLDIDWGESVEFSWKGAMSRHSLIASDLSLKRNRSVYNPIIPDDHQQFNYYESDVKISCNAKRTESVFINADMDVHPCCHLSSRIEANAKKLPIYVENGTKVIANEIKDISFNLRDRDMDSIVSDKKWQDMAFSYVEGKKIISHCEEICGKCK